MKKNKLPFSLVVDVNYLWTIANNYLKNIKDLKENEYNGYAIELLSTQAVELFIKVIIASKICLDNKNITSIESLYLLIDTSFRKYGHSIDKLINCDVEIIEKLNIKSIKKEKTSFVGGKDYIITFNNENFLFLKDIESSRYGSFAKNKNVMNGFSNPNLISFLNDLSDLSSNIKIRVFNELKEDI